VCRGEIETKGGCGAIESGGRGIEREKRIKKKEHTGKER